LVIKKISDHVGARRANEGRQKTFVHSISGPCYIENTAHNRTHRKHQIWNSSTRFCISTA